MQNQKWHGVRAWYSVKTCTRALIIIMLVDAMSVLLKRNKKIEANNWLIIKNPSFFCP